MAKTLQNKVEDLVYDAIEEIADELEISVKKYPEVYWLYRGFSFNGLGIDKKHKEEFIENKKDQISSALHRPKIIFIGNINKEFIYEESGHFLHFSESRLTFSKRSRLDLLGLYAIIEMFGYFGSKLGDSSIVPFLPKYPDFVDDNEECLKLMKEKNSNPKEFFTYQQGYGLGEKLFNSYLAGIVSKKQIHSLMSNGFKKENEALITFMGLKYNFFNFLEKNY